MPYVVPHPVYIRFPQLKDVLGFCWSRSWVINLCNQGKFPKPRRLSANRVVWDIDEVLAWKDAREAAEPQPDRKAMTKAKPAAAEPKLLAELIAAVRPELIATVKPELTLALEKPRVRVAPELELEKPARKPRVRVMLEDDADAERSAVHA